jgi:hypothetical protein
MPEIFKVADAMRPPDRYARQPSAFQRLLQRRARGITATAGPLTSREKVSPRFLCDNCAGTGKMDGWPGM